MPRINFTKRIGAGEQFDDLLGQCNAWLLRVQRVGFDMSIKIGKSAKVNLVWTGLVAIDFPSRPALNRSDNLA